MRVMYKKQFFRHFWKETIETETLSQPVSDFCDGNLLVLFLTLTEADSLVRFRGVLAAEEGGGGVAAPSIVRSPAAAVPAVTTTAAPPLHTVPLRSQSRGDRVRLLFFLEPPRFLKRYSETILFYYYLGKATLYGPHKNNSYIYLIKSIKLQDTFE